MPSQRRLLDKIFGPRHLFWPVVLFLFAGLYIFVALTLIAQARWKPEYALLPPEVREWYRKAELTPAAQARLKWRYCCDHADVVDTNFRVNETDAGDEWYYEDTPGHWKRIPPDVIHWGVSAPGGLPTLFVFGTQETCFYPGTGGIRERAWGAAIY